MVSRIYLIGLMGAGKSTVGKLLAEKLGWTFIDLDDEIEASSGMTIAEIFQESGENTFRGLESAALLNTASMKEKIIACGGGIVTRAENIEFLKRANTVWLVLSPEEAAHRLEYATDRPLLNECTDTLKKLGNILDTRQAAYEEAASIQVQSEGSSPNLIAEQVIMKLEIPHV